ncbi:arginase family protein [Halobaculum sp. MBLA0147]|uniref:arginase family protein n=1 Tax=Halobaculum sp. MBLA0147 TaxID=3079934 RepID=UPI0035254054
MPFPGATAARATDRHSSEDTDADGATDHEAGADGSGPNYVLVGAPLDATTTFQPGTRFGPDRVRRFARTFDDYDHHTGRSFSACGVHDAGDVAPWDDTSAYLDHLAAELRAAVLDDAVPLTVGGEHLVSWSGVRATEPDTFVVLDAHLDLRAAYDGNPLNHACVTRRILDGLGGADDDADDGGETHDDAADGGGDGESYPTVDEVVILGARTGSPEEWERAEATDVTVVPPAEVSEWEPSFSGSAYLSVDVDGADPAYAPGTGTMEPFGLAPREMHRVVRAVAPECVGFDVVEVNDRDDGQAAALAGKLLRAFVYEHADAHRGASGGN